MFAYAEQNERDYKCCGNAAKKRKLKGRAE
jgi:hypothetical protein